MEDVIGVTVNAEDLKSRRDSVMWHNVPFPRLHVRKHLLILMTTSWGSNNYNSSVVYVRFLNIASLVSVFLNSQRFPAKLLWQQTVGTLFVVEKQPFNTKSEMSQLEPVQVGTME